MSIDCFVVPPRNDGALFDIERWQGSYSEQSFINCTVIASGAKQTVAYPQFQFVTSPTNPGLSRVPWLSLVFGLWEGLCHDER